MLDGIIFLLFVPVCLAGPAKIWRKVLEIILPYTLFHCPPQVTIPLLDLSATCIICALKLGHRSDSCYECLEQNLSSYCELAGTVCWSPSFLIPLLPLLLVQGGFYKAPFPGTFVLGHLGLRMQSTMTVWICPKCLLCRMTLEPGSFSVVEFP